MAENKHTTMMKRPHDLERLDQLDEWQLEEGEPDIRGWNVADSNGNTLGSVDELLASTELEETIFAIVSHGGVFGIGATRILMPTNTIEIDTKNNRVIYRGSPDDVRNSPEYRDDTRDFGKYYDYWSGIQGEPAKVQETEREMVAGRKGGEAPIDTSRKAEETPKKEMDTGLKGGEAPKKEIDTSRTTKEAPDKEPATGHKGGKVPRYEEGIKLFQKQSIEEITGGRIKKK